MKKLLLALTALLVLSAPAFAVTPVDTFQMFITDSNGGFNNRTDTTFQQSETPFVYIHSPFSGFQVAASWWNDLAGAQDYFTSSNVTSNKDFWMTLDWATTPKTPGDWNVHGTYFGSTGAEQLGAAGFNFAPEPISASLFLLGGSALAVIRKKRSA